MGKTSKIWEEIFSPAKPKIKPEIWCYKGKHNSGYTTEDLIHLRGDYQLNCFVCGEPCCKGLGKNSATTYDLPEELKKFL